MFIVIENLLSLLEFVCIVGRLKREVIIVIEIMILIYFAFYLIYNADIEKGEGDLFVSQIIDGDTFKMNKGEVIRLLCVNTPELGSQGYNRASKFLESLVLFKQIKIEYGKNLDKYKRTLGFVYVNNSRKEIFVNKVIIELGFGELYSYKDKTGECMKKIS